MTIQIAGIDEECALPYIAALVEKFLDHSKKNTFK